MKEITFKESQQIALEILKKLAQICEENNLCYTLAWGTLIGAIRHKGFIPWDDDVDIVMPRPDYDRLLKIFKENKDELMPLECLAMETRKNYPHMIARISDSRTWIDVTNEKDCGMGIFVDIYPFDGVGNDIDEARKMMFTIGKNNSLIFLAARKYFHKGNTKGFLRTMIKFPAFIYTHVLGQKYFVRKTNKLLQTLDYESSTFFSCPAWFTHHDKIIFTKNQMVERIKCQFEDTEFYIPKDYDTVLRMTYGNYMQLPPENERVHHHLYKAYLKE